MKCVISKRTSVYLYLTIITDGLHRDGGSHGALCVPGPELHDILGPAHQPSDSAAVLKKLLFLILEKHHTKEIRYFSLILKMHTHLILLSISVPWTPEWDPPVCVSCLFYHSCIFSEWPPAGSLGSPWSLWRHWKTAWVERRTMRERKTCDDKLDETNKYTLLHWLYHAAAHLEINSVLLEMKFYTWAEL